MVVVFIAETDLNFVKETANDIKAGFSLQLESGILEVISPPIEYYPDFSKLRQTLGKFFQESLNCGSWFALRFHIRFEQKKKTKKSISNNTIISIQSY